MKRAVVLMIVTLAGTAGATPSWAGIAFRGKSLPECRDYLILEDNYAYRVSGSSDEDRTHYAFGEFGWMRNRSERWALGGTVLLGFRGHYSGELRTGAAVRARRWMGADRSLDISLGPIVGRADSRSHIGAGAQLAYNMGDRFHVATRLEYVETAAPGVEPLGLYLGFGFGSKPGLIAGLAVGGVLGVMAAATE